jgi:hypothetical protein
MTYAGSCTWLNGVYWLERMDSSSAKQERPLIRNLANVGKKKVRPVTVAIEEEFLFPLLRGRDLYAWRAQSSATIVIPHQSGDFSQPIAVSDLKRRAPLTYEFFKIFEKDLRGRSGYKQVHKSRPEFYVVGNTGNYLLAPFKVIFKEITEIFQCAVVGADSLKGSNLKPVIPDHKLLFITCRSRDESYFIAGVLNSIPVRCALYGASVGVQTQSYYPTDISRLKLPKFDRTHIAHGEIA